MALMARAALGGSRMARLIGGCTDEQPRQAAKARRSPFQQRTANHNAESEFVLIRQVLRLTGALSRTNPAPHADAEKSRQSLFLGAMKRTTEQACTKATDLLGTPPGQGGREKFATGRPSCKMQLPGRTIKLSVQLVSIFPLHTRAPVYFETSCYISTATVAIGRSSVLWGSSPSSELLASGGGWFAVPHQEGSSYADRHRKIFRQLQGLRLYHQ